MSSSAYLGICIKVNQTDRFHSTIPDNPSSAVPGVQQPRSSDLFTFTLSSKYCPAQHLFYTIYALLIVQDKNAFTSEICMSDSAFPPSPQHMASILANNSVLTLL